ncbi:hypothetical protein D3C76_1595040 [compost metagenome]
MIVHWLAANPLQPLMGAGVELLPRQEQLAQRAQVMPGDQFAIGVFLANRAHGSGRAEQRIDLVLLDYPPIRRGIGGADRLAFVEHRGAAVHQWPIDDQ